MSVIVLRNADATRPSFSEGLRRFRADEPALFDTGALMLLLMAPTGFAALVDTRLFHGVGVWDKPLKFQFALLVYLMTLVLFARFVPVEVRARRWYRIYAASVFAAVMLEVAWLMAAAALGVASHFNTSPIGAAIYPLMGILATLLTSMSAVQAWQIARNPATGLSPVVKEGLVMGLALVLPLTLVTAGTMASMNGHWVSGAHDDAGGLMLMGWARHGGDLRVSHFFATHAMHFVPAVGLLSAMVLGGRNRLPVRIFAALFVCFVAFAFLQALDGRPLLPFLG